MQSLPTARVIADAGFEGCAHARPGGKRQVLLVDAETLQEMDLAPGIIRENITTEGLSVNALKIGQKVLIGKVELQVSAVCEPCGELEKVRAGLQAEIVGKRGMLCKVLRGGMIQPGETIQVEAAAKSS
jgi:MOSC domain-containing protein YiiM